MTESTRINTKLPPEQRRIQNRCHHPSNTFVEFTREEIEQSITSRFEKQAKAFSERIAIKTSREQLTYGDLNALANRIARAILAQREIGQEPVALLLETDVMAIAAMLGVLKAGKFYVALDQFLPPARLKYEVEDAQAGLILTNNRNLALAREAVSDGCQVINLDSDLSNFSSGNLGLPHSPDDIAYIVYTSGSTGLPKGVFHNHRSLLYVVMTYVNRLHTCQEDRLTLLHTHSFTAAHQDIFGALLIGAAVYPWDVRQEGLAGIESWLLEEEMTIMQWAPTPFRHFIAGLKEKDGFPKLRALILGNEPIFKTDFELYKRHFALDCVFIARFGSSEAPSFRFLFLDHKSQVETSILPAGYGVPDKPVVLLDDTGHEVGLNCTGEIVVRSPYLALGYWRKPELMQAAFMPDPTFENYRVYRTGDLGIMRQDGCLELLGRKDFQVKIRGYRVEPVEIQMALTKLDEIRDAVVIARGDIDEQKCLVAYYVTTVEPGPTADELWQALAETLPIYMIPAVFVRLDTLPMTITGKVDQQALPLPGQVAPTSGRSFEAPRSRLEEDLAGIWTQILGVERVGIHDDFFVLGGHSLLAVQVISRVRSLLHVDLPFTSLFEKPTIASLAELIEAMRLTTPEPGYHTGASMASAIQPASRDGKLPLSFAQEPLWFLDQLISGNPAYNNGISRVFRLSGPLNVTALEQSLNEIVRRHESLRTNFMAVHGQPFQVVSPTLDLPLPLIDLQGLGEADQMIQLQQLFKQVATDPLDLERDPLLRTKLVRLGNEEHVLIICVHHLIGDGWSAGVLSRELSALYRTFSRGESEPLPELPIQYPDFAIWHRQWVEEGHLESQLCYWKEQLGSNLPVLELPTDRVRPAAQTYRGAKKYLVIPKDLYHALRAVGQQKNCTLFMTLLAAFDILLYRYTGQDEIIIGSPIAARNRPEIEGLIGLFLNILVYRSDLSGNPTFVDLLDRVREMTLAAYRNQDVPFEKLVQLLNPVRDPSRSPLFQVLFEASPLQELELDGLSVTPLEFDDGTAQFDLSLRLREGATGLRGHFEYNTDLFDASSIDWLAIHFQALLEAIALDPQQHVSELPLLSEAERRQLLVEWNDTWVDYPQHLCLHQMFEVQAERVPDVIAVSFEGQDLTYQALNRRANQLAHRLQRLGVGPEVLVGVYMERSLEMVISLYAILKAGGAYVPLDPESPRDRVAFMLADTQVPVLLSQQRLAANLPEHSAQVICLDSEWGTIVQECADNPRSGTTPENLAYVIYTSGSTGRPKGVMNTHRGICNRLLWMQDQYRLTEADRVVQKTPFSFDVSVWEFFWSLMVGARLIVARPEGHRDSAYLARLIVEHGITTIHFVPSMLQVFLEEKNVEKCHSLRRVICSGEALSYTLQERFFECLDIELHNLYGPTEAAVDVTYWQCQRSSSLRTVPIGRPVANTQIYILDRSMQPVPVGVAGELHIGGVQVARGYLNRPELTGEKFIPDPFSDDPEARLYKTGDLACYLPDGNVEFLGRLDYQVKVRGNRIELGEIESVLRQHPAVREAVVLAREDVPGDIRLVAYVVPNHQLPLCIGEVRGFLRDKLPEYMVPSAFAQLEVLPLTSNGKVDRRSLPAPEKEIRSEDQYIAPQTELERLIAGIWCQLLQVEMVGVGDNFFDLGGHSLLLVQVQRRLCAALNRELPVTDMFRFPTIRSLAQYLSQESDDGNETARQKSAERATARREALLRRQERRRGANLEKIHDNL